MTGARKGASGAFATSDDIENASGVAGASVTAALEALLAAVVALQADVAALEPVPIVSQIGWDTGGASNVLEVLPAGHAPGQYELCLTIVVRTVSANATTATTTWTSPIFGAESKTFGQGMLLNANGTSSFFTGATGRVLRAMPIVSTGATPITVQLSAGSAGGVADIYASARLIAE